MRLRPLAQNKTSLAGNSRPLPKIVVKTADRLVIDAFGKQESIQIELDRMQSQKTSRNVVGFGRVLTKLDGRVVVLRCQV